MKNIDFKLGGHPLTNDTLKFLQDAIQDVEKGSYQWLNGFDLLNQNTIIVRGLDTNLIDNSVSFGAVWHRTDQLVLGDGELLTVEACPIRAIPSNWDYYLIESTDPTIDPVIYENGNTENIHLSRRLVPQDKTVVGNVGIFAVDSIVGAFPSPNPNPARIEYVISNFLFQGNDNNFRDSLYSSIINQIASDVETINFQRANMNEWSTLSWSVLLSPQNVGTIQEQPQARLTGVAGNYKVELRGVFQQTAGPTWWYLPTSDYYPTINKTLSIPIGGVSQNDTLRGVLQVVTDGTLRLLLDIGELHVDSVITLDGLSFYIR